MVCPAEIWFGFPRPLRWVMALTETLNSCAMCVRFRDVARAPSR